jgi:hypothetical protein
MSDKPRSFKEVVAAQNPAERARMENRETFNDVMVRNPFHQEVSVHEDRDDTGEWRVEYFDDDVAAMSPCLPALKPRGGRVTISTRSSLDGYGPFEPSSRHG